MESDIEGVRILKLLLLLLAAAQGCVYEFNSSGAKIGNFTSPNYPDLYPGGTQCLYVFNAYRWEGIRIEFLAFNLEPAYSAG